MGKSLQSTKASTASSWLRYGRQTLSQKESEIQELKATISNFESQKELIKKDTEQALSGKLSDKEKELVELQAQLDRLRLEHQNELQASLTNIEKERDQIQNQLLLQEKENELSLASVKQNYEAQLKAANEQVEFYKNFKAQQSTKAIGESLEHYAESEFNKVRSFAFPNAYFGKDNEVSSASGSKGDFIFREADENGVEILSIMFEMKNEADTTKTKHKNSDFYKELDKDRREKKCEYAVLVTMLEADNDYFCAMLRSIRSSTSRSWLWSVNKTLILRTLKMIWKPLKMLLPKTTIQLVKISKRPLMKLIRPLSVWKRLSPL